MTGTPTDLFVEVYGEAYIQEQTLIDGPKEVCLEFEGDSFTLTIPDSDTTIEFEVVE